LRPWSMRRHGKVRLGAEFDGAYVVPTRALECDVAVSIGIGSEVSFDLALAQRAKVFQYDHTVHGPPVSHPNFHFQKKGLGSACSDEFVDLTRILDDIRPHNPQHALLKFDIEGAEYSALGSIQPAALQAFEVIACELHNFEKLNQRPYFEAMYRLFSILSVQHVPVHLHANNALGMVFLQGIAIPCLLEVSYLRRDLDVFNSHSTEPIPGPLDKPNLPWLPDICLNFF
jgi:hypothetical protein